MSVELSLWKLSSEHMDYQEPSVAMTGPPFESERVWSLLWNTWGLSTRSVYRTGRKVMEKWNVAMRPFWKIVRISRLEARDWRKALQDFLFQYRVTPHTVTGMSPAELLMGRKLRDKLPQVEFKQIASNRAILAAAVKRKRCACETSTKRICGQDTSS